MCNNFISLIVTKSLADSSSGLPDDSLVVSILPITLDTPMNRKWMPKADFSTWTPLDFIAEYDQFRRKFDFQGRQKNNFPIFFPEHSLNGLMEMSDQKMAL